MMAATNIILILALAVCSAAQDPTSQKHSLKAKVEAHLTKVCEDDAAREDACSCVGQSIEEVEAYLAREEFAEVQSCLENSIIGKKILTAPDAEKLFFITLEDKPMHDFVKMVSDKVNDCCGLNKEKGLKSKRGANPKADDKKPKDRGAPKHPKLVALEDCVNKHLTEEERVVAERKLKGRPDCFHVAEALQKS